MRSKIDLKGQVPLIWVNMTNFPKWENNHNIICFIEAFFTLQMNPFKYWTLKYTEGL